tara:strand:+ start:2408 stop:3232 length:825 start_codon:yes stop_codon:yes gene_type:complete
MFEFGFSTYAMKKLDPYSALKIISESNYKYVEICIADDWPTAPSKFGKKKQLELLRVINDYGLISKHTFGFLDICDMSKNNLDKIKMKFDMANEINNSSTSPILTTTLGKSAPSWETGKTLISQSLSNIGDLASEYGLVLAVEPHAGTDFESPEKANWLINNINHGNITIDLDLSHFIVEGYDMEKSIALCAEIASVIHIKDGYKVNDEIHYCLTGDGQIDVDSYLSLIKSYKLNNLPIFSEVSQQQSLLDIYEPEIVARYCYKILEQSRKNIT